MHYRACVMCLHISAMNNDINNVVLHTRQVSKYGAHHLKGSGCRCKSIWYTADST